jgi:probable F420-dependent oxidoreductase
MRIGISLPVRELRDDVSALRDFAQTAEGLGLTHLRVPDQVVRPGSGHLHEPLTLLSYIAAVTERIELVPSVIVLPARQTALVAKQAAEIDRLSGGRLRLGVGVGGSREEYEALGQDFHTRGERCDEQIELLRLLWTCEEVCFEGRWDRVRATGIDPLPIQQPIPIWIGPGPSSGGLPAESVLRRIGRLADGWFAIVPPAKASEVNAAVRRHAQAAGRDADRIGLEAAVSIAGKSTEACVEQIEAWQAAGATHLCLRTLGAGLAATEHLDALQRTPDLLGDVSPG